MVKLPTTALMNKSGCVLKCSIALMFGDPYGKTQSRLN